MDIHATNPIVLLILLIHLYVTSPDRNESPNKVNRTYADLLSSLIKVNEERIATLKKLSILNSLTYGRDVLRSNIQNKLEHYDKMQNALIVTLQHILEINNDGDIVLLPKFGIDEKRSNFKIVLRNDESGDESNEENSDKSDPDDNRKSA